MRFGEIVGTVSDWGRGLLPLARCSCFNSDTVPSSDLIFFGEAEVPSARGKSFEAAYLSIEEIIFCASSSWFFSLLIKLLSFSFVINPHSSKTEGQTL